MTIQKMQFHSEADATPDLPAIRTEIGAICEAREAALAKATQAAAILQSAYTLRDEDMSQAPFSN